MSLHLDIEKNLGTFHLNMRLDAANEIVALLGASGSGKSFTLKCIAGIETPDRGQIVVDGVTLFDSEKDVNLSLQQRGVGLMFQNYALFPNMTVLENIRAGARREKNRRQREENVSAVMQSFGLGAFANRLPHQLSGGQQQRVALARLLASAPGMLLLDEPFSALDSHLRFELEREMQKTLREFGKSVLLVSHDRDEVFRMSDRVAIVEDGHVTDFGNRRDVFFAPKTRSGARLTGCKFISEAHRVAPGRVRAMDWDIELEIEDSGDEINAVGIRMDGVKLGAGTNAFRCRVMEEIENPSSCTLLLRPVDAPQGQPFGWAIRREQWEEIKNDTVDICIPREAILPLKD